MVKKLLIILLIILVLIFGIGFLLPNNYSVKRSIVISSTSSKIFAQIKDFQKWSKWSPWAFSDPEQKIEITGEPGKVGHKQIWSGKINGKGSMTLDTIVEDNFLEMSLEFTEPDSMQAISRIILERSNNETLVVWETRGNLNNVFEKYFGLFMGNLLGADLESGLKNLKNLVESK